MDGILVDTAAPPQSIHSDSFWAFQKFHRAANSEGDDSKVMAENLGLIDQKDRDIARHLAPRHALICSNHFEPYIEAGLTPFYKKKTES
jgi:hypothetical protein